MRETKENAMKRFMKKLFPFDRITWVAMVSGTLAVGGTMTVVMLVYAESAGARIYAFAPIGTCILTGLAIIHGARWMFKLND